MNNSSMLNFLLIIREKTTHISTYKAILEEPCQFGVSVGDMVAAAILQTLECGSTDRQRAFSLAGSNQQAIIVFLFIFR